jgi:phosphoglycerate dehydrogenase-like enzyme
MVTTFLASAQAKAFCMKIFDINSSRKRNNDLFDKVDNMEGLDQLLSQSDVAMTVTALNNQNCRFDQ